MEAVPFKQSEDFLRSPLLPSECWTHVLCFAVKRLKWFSSLNRTCHSLRALVNQPVAITSLFQSSVRSVIGRSPPIKTVLTFLEDRVPQEWSKKFVLDFSKYQEEIIVPQLVRIFKSFPYLSKLNLCIEQGKDSFLGLTLLHRVAQTVPLPVSLTVVVWQLECEEVIQRELQSQYPTLTLCLVPLPPPSAVRAHLRLAPRRDIRLDN
jgi:hypothetical protein